MITLPKSDAELWEVFKNARLPEIREFHGEYSVQMLTLLPSLHRLRHRKSFVTAEKTVIGENILFRDFRWGSFFLEEVTMEEPERLKVILINYKTPENTILTRNIRDMVRAVDGEKLYLGRFNMLIRGKLRFMGYFSLTKIDRSDEGKKEHGGRL